MNAPVTIEMPRPDRLNDVHRLLDIKRQSIFNIGSTAAAHLDLALGSLEIRSDEAFLLHFSLALSHFKATAKLAIDLRATREEAGL
jgi:hypothetical protein